MTTQVITAVGRIVWGNPLVSREQKDNSGNVKRDAQGQPKKEFSFGLAIPKDQCAEMFAAMQTEANMACPQGLPPNFAWKFKDGDTGVDAKGAPLNTREGYAMCAVFAFTTEFAIPVYQRQGGGQLVQMTQGVKTGDFVRVAVTVNGHGAKPGVMGSKAGLYLNPTMVEFVGYGEAINRGQDPDEVFAQPAALPPGASATPQASGPMPSVPGAPVAPPQTPQAAPQPPGLPPQPQAAPQPPGLPPQPHTAFPNGPQPGQTTPAAPGGYPWDKK